MIAIEASTFLQSLHPDSPPHMTSNLSVVDGHAISSLDFVSKLAVSPQSHEDAVELLLPSRPSPGKRKRSPTNAKPVAQLTRRQLKHREAMVRFRQRKKVKISSLEEQEDALQRQLEATIEQYHQREFDSLMTSQQLLTTLDPRVHLQRAIVDSVLQIEAILDENDALHEAIAEHEKFHATLKRVREKSIETSFWKCL